MEDFPSGSLFGGAARVSSRLSFGGRSLCKIVADDFENYLSGRRFHRHIVATLSRYRSAAISFSGYFFKSLNGSLKRTPRTPENG
jgi:hypothetical protein